MNRFLRRGVTAFCSMGLLAVGAAQNVPTTPEQQAKDDVRFRQADMVMQAYSLAPVLPMLQGAPFDATVVQRAATRLDIMMEMLPDVFRTNTSGFQLKNNARPEIWTDPLGFDLKIREMRTAVAKLASAARTRDKDATLSAASATLGACRACHSKYGQGLE